MYEDMAKFEEAVQGAAEDGNEVILVMPDGFSKLRGGFYSNSPTVGNYQDFVGKDLVDWVDANYRTIATRAGRGLSGHSMGGYGTLRLGMTLPGEIRQPVRDERLLPFADDAERRAGGEDRGDDRRGRGQGRLRRARTRSRRSPPGRLTRPTRRSMSTPA